MPKLAELHIIGLPYQGYGCPGKSNLLDGMMMMELARVDSSIATFRGVHSGLARPSSGHVMWQTTNCWRATASCLTTRWGALWPMPKRFTLMKETAK